MFGTCSPFEPSILWRGALHNARCIVAGLKNGGEIRGARLLVLEETAAAIPDAAVGRVVEAMLALA